MLCVCHAANGSVIFGQAQAEVRIKCNSNERRKVLVSEVAQRNGLCEPVRQRVISGVFLAQGGDEN